MSLKDLFGADHISKVVSAKSLDDLGTEAESAANIIIDRRQAKEFLPPIDFSSASNFAVYGSAEKYYSDSVTRIYQEFPYDGSQKALLYYLPKAPQSLIQMATPLQRCLNILLPKVVPTQL